MAYPTISPYLCVSDAAAAIKWYEAHLGAECIYQMPADNGKLLHARLIVYGGTVMLSDDFPEWTGGKSRTPEALGGSPVSLHIEVPDADAAFERAVAGGAQVAMPLADMFWGARYGSVICPFGHSWDFSTTREEMTPEQMAAAAEKWQAEGN